MKYWNLYSGGHKETPDNPPYHELHIIEVGWFWLAAQWLLLGLLNVLWRIPLPKWPRMRFRWINEGQYIESTPAAFYGSIGGIAQSLILDRMLSHVYQRTLIDGPRVRVSCGFFNSLDTHDQCECGYQPQAPEQRAPVAKIIQHGTTTFSGIPATQISVVWE